jgi:hypothetical protein
LGELTNRAVLTLQEGPDISPVTPADGYRASARQLLCGLESLVVHPPDNLMARALLAGFVVEATLKSFLAGRLHRSEILAKPPYGHDLEELWREAVAHGLDVPRSVPDWCVQLNGLTGKPNFFARYHTGVHGMTYPVQDDMMMGIRDLLGKTEASFHSSALRVPAR